uniref:Uncharacterized protein n=1 Tax=Spumella elongata TaxID=89044 RepID=A0A7S3HFR0_9STRA|mmetsp:Transcript_50370/g.87926  ORF Transcript_50370/g.87926 Transcript_50370/m.87926 type:complete len:135 (+) Transcript_50370:44-448(+)
MVGRGLQVKPIKSVRTEDGKYKYSDEQKMARNAKDRARRMKLKIDRLEEANSELKKVNNFLTKTVARQEKKVQGKNDNGAPKVKRTLKAVRDATDLIAVAAAMGIGEQNPTTASVKAKKVPKSKNVADVVSGDQ